MKIDFNNVELQKIEHFKGGDKHLEVKMVTDELNKIMKGTLIKGASIGMHTHDNSSEIIFITSGHGKTITDGVTEYLSAGDCHYCKKGSTHTLINESDEPLEFVAVVPSH